MMFIASNLQRICRCRVWAAILISFWTAQIFAQDLNSLLSGFPFERCDDTKSYPFDKWNYLLSDESELFSACVDAGKSIVVEYWSDALRGIQPLTKNPIIVRPKMDDDMLFLDSIGVSSGSRLFMDRLCRRNFELFDGLNYLPGGGCPGGGFYSFSVNNALGAFFNFGVGTLFSIDTVLNPLVVGPGKSGAIRQNNIRGLKDDVLYMNSVRITGISTEQIILKGLVMENDFIIDKSVGGYVSLSELIVLGSLKISLSELESLSLSQIWVGGDLIIEATRMESLRLQGVRVLGDLLVDDIVYLKPTDDWSTPIRFDTIDIKGRVSVERPNTFASSKMEKDFDEFFKRLDKQISYMRKLRQKTR